MTVTFMSEPEVERQKLMEVPTGCQQLSFTDYRNEWGRFWSVSYFRGAVPVVERRKHPGLYGGEYQVIYRGNL